MSKTDETLEDNTSLNERLTGRVKWFNNRAGFGFITVLTGKKTNEDIFVHHSGIIVEDEQYKYLVQGEYISFLLRNSDNKEHPYQAGDVKGVLNGWLMCETRNANRASRDNDETGQNVNDRRPRRPRNNKRRPRSRGNEHQDETRNNNEWAFNRQNNQNTQTTTTS
tara:strand:+ start:1917 stop:2414 length:498 start_codon:yes stop_codon:yes gene_type:complete